MQPTFFGLTCPARGHGSPRLQPSPVTMITVIVVEVTQSSTVAVPGQAAEDEPVVTASITEPSLTTPVSMLDGKKDDENF